MVGVNYKINLIMYLQGFLRKMLGTWYELLGTRFLWF